MPNVWVLVGISWEYQSTSEKLESVYLSWSTIVCYWVGHEGNCSKYQCAYTDHEILDSWWGLLGRIYTTVQDQETLKLNNFIG